MSVPMKPQRIYYQKCRVTIKGLPFPIRCGVCSACKRSKLLGEIKTTQMHHTLYQFKTETVKKNPLLALENTLEFGFGCHQIADALRKLLLSNPRGGIRSVNRIMQVIPLLPDDQQDNFTKLAKAWLRRK